MAAYRPEEAAMLRLSAPVLSARLGGDVLASTLARLLSSGLAASKSDLVRISGLSRSTVDVGVEYLLDRGLIRRAGFRHTPGRGRAAEVLELSPDFGCVLVADSAVHSTRLSVFDMRQHLLGTTTVGSDFSRGPTAVLDDIVTGFQELLMPLDTRPVVAVMGTPGPVDYRSGSVVRPPFMPGWDGFPISNHLAEALDCAVVIENDVNLRALGEARNGRDSQGPLLYIQVGLGIGAGIVADDGHLLRGFDGSAGEIGHIKVVGQDTPCICGSSGCLETVASAAALTRRMLGIDPIATISPDDLERFRLAFSSGSPEVMADIRASSEFVGEVVASLVHMLNPHRVVMGGLLALEGDEMLATVRGIVYQKALPLATRELVLGRPALGELSGERGGLIAGIERVLSPETLASIPRRVA